MPRIPVIGALYTSNTRNYLVISSEYSTFPRSRGEDTRIMGTRVDLPGRGFVGWHQKFNHRLDPHVAVLELPSVVLFQKHRTDEPVDRGCSGICRRDQRGASPPCSVAPGNWSSAACAVLLGEIQIRQDVGLVVVDERGEVRPFLPQLIGHVT